MKPGRVFVLLILLVGGIGSFVNGAVFYTRTLELGVLVVLISWLSSAFALRGIKVERRSRTLRAAVGDVFEEHYEIQNTSIIPKLWIEIVNETNMPNSSGSRVLTLVSARQKRSYTARTWLTGRGGFSL